jgi:hypothetical protein
VVVQRVLQFFTQRLYLQFLGNQVAVQLNDLKSELFNLRRLACHNPELALQITDLVLE